MSKTTSTINSTASANEEKKAEKPIKTTKKGVVANCDLLNVRKEPNISSEIIKTLSVGTEIEILGTEKGFYKIADGYVMKTYITV